MIILLGFQATLADAAGQDDWTFGITPHIWAEGFAGSIAKGAATAVGIQIDIDYELFNPQPHDLTGLPTFTASKGPWRFLAESVYLDAVDDFGTEPLYTDAELENVIVEGTVGYQIPRYENIELIAGGRFFSIRDDIQLSLRPGGGSKKTWAEPFIGARLNYALSNRWYAGLRADVGGFGGSSNEMYNIAAFVGYRFNQITTLKLGYRHLSPDFEKNLFDHETSLQGVGLDFGIRF